MVDTYETSTHIPRQNNSDNAMNMKLLETLSKVRATNTAIHIPRQKNSYSAMNMKLLETLSKVRATNNTATHIPRQKNSDSAMNMKLLETLSKVRSPLQLASPTMLLYARQAIAQQSNTRTETEEQR